MDVTAQNPKVNDIWSMPDQPAQVNPPPTDPDNPQNNQSVRDNGSDAPSASSGSFGKPGLARGGESGSWQETLTAEDLLEKARKAEAEQVAELYKAPEIPSSAEAGEKLRPVEVLRALEIQKPQSKKEPSKPSPKVVLQEESLKGKVVDRRTGKEKTHRVDINNADEVTKTADLKEQDFIEHVEKEHIQSIL
jgi:hypothetical protein